MAALRQLIGRIRTITRWLRPLGIPLHSAYTGFFLILSLFPSLLLLLGLLKYTSYGIEDLMLLLEGFLPQAFLPTVKMLVEASYRHSSGTVVSVSALAALWSASRGMYGLLGGLNAVYGIQDSRPYLRKRGLCVAYTFFFLLVLLMTLVVHVFGTTFLDYLQMTTNPAIMLLMRIFDFKFLLLLGLQAALFTIMYALLPGRRNRLRRSIPGALLAAFGWLTYSKLFSIYVDYFSDYANIFGSIYALALAMLWLYFCISILFYGSALNRWLTERSP